MRIEKLMSVAIVTIGLIVSMNACKTSNGPIPLNHNQMQSSNIPINKLYQSLKEGSQDFTVTAGASQTIRGTRGTIITFNPWSFKDQSGAVISSGNIHIELTEALTPGQMIMNRVSTVTEANNLLQSGGCINIVATLNQQPVFANSYNISFKQPAPSELPMALFNGMVAADGAVTWSNDTSNTVAGTTNLNDPTGRDSLGSWYVFDSCTNFNWINCDYFYTAPDPKTDVKVVMPDGSYNDTTTSVIVIFPALNVVANMSTYNAATNTFSLGTPGYFIPVGTTIKVVIMGIKNNVHFFELKSNVTVTNGITINAAPSNTTLSNIQTILSGL